MYNLQYTLLQIKSFYQNTEMIKMDSSPKIFNLRPFCPFSDRLGNFHLEGPEMQWKHHWISAFMEQNCSILILN